MRGHRRELRTNQDPVLTKMLDDIGRGVEHVHESKIRVRIDWL